MKLSQPTKVLILIAAFALWSGGLAHAGTATGMSGFYYSGVNSSGVLLASGAQDPNWSVTYAQVAGSQNTAYQGAAYVINSTYLPTQGYVQNTTTSQWITAPNAQIPTGGSPNTGGDFLPGNGNANGGGANNKNEGVYIYTLAFQIKGTGSGTVTNAVSLTVTIAADDQYTLYLNPTGNGTSIPAGTGIGSRTSAWTNTASLTIANSAAGGKAVFNIGTNYLVVVVDNTNSVAATSTATDLNASGMLVYQVSNVITIGTSTVTGTLPEVGTWIPVVGALGLLGVCRWRRRRSRLPAAAGS